MLFIKFGYVNGRRSDLDSGDNYSVYLFLVFILIVQFMFCLFRFEKKYELEKLKNQEKRIEMLLEHKNKDNIKMRCKIKPLK